MLSKFCPSGEHCHVALHGLEGNGSWPSQELLRSQGCTLAQVWPQAGNKLGIPALQMLKNTGVQKYNIMRV